MPPNASLVSRKPKVPATEKTTNLSYLPNTAKGLYIFSTNDTIGCPNKWYKVGLSGNIKNRVSGYHLTEPYGVEITATLKCHDSYNSKDLNALEKQLFNFLLEDAKIKLLKVETRVKKSGEWLVGKHKDMKNRLEEFYHAYEKHFPPFKSSEAYSRMIPGITFFDEPTKEFKCTDVLTHDEKPVITERVKKNAKERLLKLLDQKSEA